RAAGIAVAGKRGAVDEPRTVEQPRRIGGVADDECALPLTLVVRAVLDADERRLGPPEVSPLRDPPESTSFSVNAPEEVVRREERQISAAIPVLNDDVVFVRGHVLVVPWKHDEVVGTCEHATVDDRLDVC